MIPEVLETMPLFSVMLPFPLTPTLRVPELIQFPPLIVALPTDPGLKPMSPVVLETLPSLSVRLPVPDSPTLRNPELVQLPPLTVTVPLPAARLPRIPLVLKTLPVVEMVMFPERLLPTVRLPPTFHVGLLGEFGITFPEMLTWLCSQPAGRRSNAAATAAWQWMMGKCRGAKRGDFESAGVCVMLSILGFGFDMRFAVSEVTNAPRLCPIRIFDGC